VSFSQWRARWWRRRRAAKKAREKKRREKRREEKKTRERRETSVRQGNEQGSSRRTGGWRAGKVEEHGGGGGCGSCRHERKIAKCGDGRRRPRVVSVWLEDADGEATNTATGAEPAERSVEGYCGRGAHSTGGTGRRRS